MFQLSYLLNILFEQEKVGTFTGTNTSIIFQLLTSMFPIKHFKLKSATRTWPQA